MQQGSKISVGFRKDSIITAMLFACLIQFLKMAP